EPVEVECLPSGAEGRCRGAAGRPGHATPVRQTSRRCRCWPGRRWRAPSQSRSSAYLLALKAGAAALPVSLATPHQCARPRGAAAAGRAAAGERRAGRGRVPAFWRWWPAPRRCRSAWPRHTSAPDLEVLPPLAGLLLAGAELVEVEGVPVGAAALPVSLAAPHQCARPRGAAAAGRAAAGERRAGRGRVPAFWR
ncbi:hypothetical protein, partial [Sphaerotilus sulfidivorans]